MEVAKQFGEKIRASHQKCFLRFFLGVEKSTFKSSLVGDFFFQIFFSEMRTSLLGFSGPSITVRSYSITGFTLVLTRRVSVLRPFLWGKVLQNPPVLPRSGHDRGVKPPRPAKLTRANQPANQTPPNQPGANQKTGANPRQTNPPPYLPPYLRQPAPLFAGAIDRGQQPGQNKPPQPTQPGQQTTRKRANRSNPTQPPQTPNNPANGHLK